MCNEGVTEYRERLWPSPWLFLATALVLPATLLVFWPISIPAGIVVAIALYAGCVVALLATAAPVEVADGRLRAGRARLPVELIGQLTHAVGEEAFLERGQRLDARAWLLLRGWIDPVVRVELRDEHDPTPYWLISTRRPQQLIAAIEAAKAAV